MSAAVCEGLVECWWGGCAGEWVGAEDGVADAACVAAVEEDDEAACVGANAGDGVVEEGGGDGGFGEPRPFGVVGEEGVAVAAGFAMA